MLNLSKKRLVIAVTAAVATFGTYTAQAEDFGASTTLLNTLAVTNVNDLDIGSVFAATTASALIQGVAALVISPDGDATDTETDSGEVNMISLSTPVPAQASVDMTAAFNIALPNTSGVDPVDFAVDASSTLIGITNAATATTQVTELEHSSGDPAVPSLWLMHFTVGDVSGGVVAPATGATANDGAYTVTPGFSDTTYVFNIGATVTTEPTAAATPYQEGTYSGTFTVTAEY